MNVQRKTLSLIAGTVVALTATTAFAALVLVEQSTKSKGATTITWESAFEDLDYTLGNTITMTVNWTVDSGAASYDSLVFKKATPKSKKDPAEVDEYNIIVTQSGNSVTVEFEFTGLHLDKKREVEIGNAHFKLYLIVDKDGDGTPETRAGFGVNCHVEDPQ